MEIVNEFPPNISEIRKTFDLSGHNPVFAYGDKLYNPSGGDISAHLLVHEMTHQRQQQKVGVDVWWGLYLSNPAFRLEQEVEAYREQYQFVSKYFGRPHRRIYLREFARNLSSKLYGSLCNLETAEDLIKHYA